MYWNGECREGFIGYEIIINVMNGCVKYVI